LLEVILALRPGGGLADLLHRWHQQSNKDGDNGDHDEEFDECEAPPLPRSQARHGWPPEKGTNGNRRACLDCKSGRPRGQSKNERIQIIPESRCFGGRIREIAGFKHGSIRILANAATDMELLRFKKTPSLAVEFSTRTAEMILTMITYNNEIAAEQSCPSETRGFLHATIRRPHVDRGRMS